jgi:dihydrofolate synthase/folylpolyglutamate synthase
MLADKDCAGVLGELHDSFDRWHAVTTDGPRGLAAAQLAERARPLGIEMHPGGDVASTMESAAQAAAAGDRIVVFGSFHTVGPALLALQDPL